MNAVRAASNNKINEEKTSALIAAGLGGIENISDVDCCVTRLRCTVKNPHLVDETILKQSGSRGIIRKGEGIQIIYGPTVPVIKTNLEEFLAHPVFDPVSDEEEGIYTVDVVKSPIKGKKIPLTQVPDDVFSEKMLGEGFAVEPEKGEIYAPVTGYVSAIFDTKHAIGFVSEKGAEVLVHVGIDTVQLNGRHYDIQVEPGQQVKVGEFISTARKEKRMTQKELAEQIGVSDKTISRWETGNGLPDMAYLTPLCDFLGVSVNELLSGEKLPPNEYSMKAEENILE